MSLVLNESLVLAKTRSQDLKSVLKLNCWGSGIKDVSLVRQLVNVEVIGLSCNEISTLEDFAYCPKLKELILRKNKIKNIAEVAHLQNLPKLTSLWLGENPCVETTHNYRKVVLKALPNLTVLDNIPVSREELQEIEDLGNEIYEEVPYESSNSSSSGPSSSANQSKNQPVSETYETKTDIQDTNQELASSNNPEHYINETSYFQPNELNDNSMITAGGQHNLSTDVQYANPNSSLLNKTSQGASSKLSSAHLQQSRCLSSQGSVTALNGYQNWSMLNNNNNNLLPKGGRSRNGNILSAILCLVKELDYTGCEVVQTALHCRMEETLP